MKQWINNQTKAFTLIEVLIASLLLVVVSMGVYRFLESQNKTQMAVLGTSAQNNLAQATLKTFEQDLSQVDANWQKLGVAAIYPHPGYRFGENFYVANSDPEQGLSDGITFLRKDTEKTTIFQITTSVQDPDPDASQPDVVAAYGDWIELEINDNTDELAENDWVLLYQSGSYLLGIIEDINSSGANTQIKLSHPESFIQDMHLNESGNSTAFPIKPGVVPGSYDYNGLFTSDAVDDVILFDANESYVQIVRPVTYELDWMTDDGQPKSAANAYNLDNLGQKQAIVVRTQYDNAIPTREYLGKVDSLGFAYDILVGQNWMGQEWLDGYTDGDIMRDVGREQNASMAGFFQLNVNPDTSTTSFIASANIVGVRMMVTSTWMQDRQELTAYNETKQAIDLMFADERYQRQHYVQARDTGDLNPVVGLSASDHLGKPLYFRSPSDDQDYIVMPVMNMDLESGEPGKLVFMDRQGCPATAACPEFGNPPANEDFIVSFGDADHHFFPSNVQTITQNSKTFLMVTGMGMVGEIGAGATRVPMMATIEITGGSMASQLSSTATGLCSIDNCQLHVMETQSAGTPLKDTASGMFMYENELWLSSMTKESVDDASMKLYKTTFDDESGTMSNIETVNLETGSTLEDRVVSAIGDQPIEHEGQAYIPVCLTRSTPCTRPVEPEAEPANFFSYLLDVLNPIETCYASGSPCDAAAYEDGKVYLYDMSGTQSPILLANHNFKCSTLQSVGGNLLVGGKLVTQVLHEDEIQDILQGAEAPTLYTDEIADLVEQTFADAYFVFDSAYGEEGSTHGNPYNSNYGSLITWNSGASVNKFNNGSMGVALGNRLSVRGASPSDNYFSQTVLTVDMSPGGMEDTVISSIRTNLENLSETTVSTSYHDQQISLAGDVVLPGSMYSDPSNPRQSVAPLPPIMETMSEDQWLEFYLDYFDPSNRHEGTPWVLRPPSSFEQCSTNAIPSSCNF